MIESLAEMLETFRLSLRFTPAQTALLRRKLVVFRHSPAHSLLLSAPAGSPAADQS